MKGSGSSAGKIVVVQVEVALALLGALRGPSLRSSLSKARNRKVREGIAKNAKKTKGHLVRKLPIILLFFVLAPPAGGVVGHGKSEKQ